MNGLSTESNIIGGGGLGWGGNSNIMDLAALGLVFGDGFGGGRNDCDQTLAIQNSINEQTIAELQAFNATQAQIADVKSDAISAITASTYSVNSGIALVGQQVNDVKASLGYLATKDDIQEMKDMMCNQEMNQLRSALETKTMEAYFGPQKCQPVYSAPYPFPCHDGRGFGDNK